MAASSARSSAAHVLPRSVCAQSGRGHDSFLSLRAWCGWPGRAGWLAGRAGVRGRTGGYQEGLGRDIPLCGLLGFRDAPLLPPKLSAWDLGSLSPGPHKQTKFFGCLQFSTRAAKISKCLRGPHPRPLCCLPAPTASGASGARVPASVSFNPNPVTILRNGTRTPQFPSFQHPGTQLRAEGTGLSQGHLRTSHCPPYSRWVPSLERKGRSPGVEAQVVPVPASGVLSAPQAPVHARPGVAASQRRHSRSGALR